MIDQVTASDASIQCAVSRDVTGVARESGIVTNSKFIDHLVAVSGDRIATDAVMLERGGPEVRNRLHHTVIQPGSFIQPTQQMQRTAQELTAQPLPMGSNLAVRMPHATVRSLGPPTIATGPRTAPTQSAASCSSAAPLAGSDGPIPPRKYRKRAKTDTEKEANRLARNEDKARKKRKKWGEMPKEERQKAAKDKNSARDKKRADK